MSLPSQEVLDEINNLITEVTGFQDGDENFTICQRYCLSHVVHHTYPFLSKTTVKNLISSYVSRFYGHGYFKVSRELENQVKGFLSNENLFEKNPQFRTSVINPTGKFPAGFRIVYCTSRMTLLTEQVLYYYEYDIQWSLLSLLSSLSSNLTSLKELPELLPTDEEESETEDFDWKEYLMSDLPKNDCFLNNEEEFSEDEEEHDESKYESSNIGENDGNICQEAVEDQKLCQDKKSIEIIFDNKIMFEKKNSAEIRQQRLQDLVKNRESKRSLEADAGLWGNIIGKLNELLYQEGIVRKNQLMSEYEVMENILFQLQTGERIFLRKGLEHPSLTSLSEETLGNYLESLEPYFKIIRSFEDFNNEITGEKFPEVNLVGSSIDTLADSNSVDKSKRKIPNVLYMYNVVLRKSLEPFQRKVIEIVENLGSYTLLQMERELQKYFSDLTSFYYVHNLAVENWKHSSNWMSSIRILSFLYKAIMEATSSRLSFLYLNFFLHCFQVYLDIIDSWICFLDLTDPNDEFIVVKCSNHEKSENKCSEYEIRPYKTEIGNFGIKNVPVLDLISEKMVPVGQSLEVLKRLNRFVTQSIETSKETFYQQLVKSINEKVQKVGKADAISKRFKPQGKQRSIFTAKNVGLVAASSRSDNSFEIGDLIEVLKEEEKEKKEETPPPKEIEIECENHCGEFIYSIVENHFFKMTFDNIGPKQVKQQLEKAKERLELESKNEIVMVVKKPEEGKSGIYPLNKIITESFYEILGSRISGACTLVKDIVLKECNLPVHLALLRSILLFNDSYLIQPFFLAFYTQPFIWGSSYSLSFHLKECVRSFYRDNVNSLSVIVTKNGQNKFENVLEAIDFITVNYEVKWPLTLIITPEVMRKYNEIFRLALKLKWAHWAFCNLHFESKGEEEKGLKSTQHRLRLLRFWLLSALGRINNYFMTQMTPSDLNLSSCRDLKEIIHRHSEFLDKIYENCLLGNKSPEGRKLIQETLLKLCLDVFLEGGDIRDSKLSAIEKNFASCHLSLSHLLYLLEK